MSRTTKALQSTAYHEAGHAVAAWHSGKKTHQLILSRRACSHGGLNLAPYYMVLKNTEFASPELQQRVSDSALVLLAGPAAQRRFNPRGYRHQHGETDIAHVGALISYLSPVAHLRLSDYAKLLETRAHNMVRAPRLWAAIELLADRLLKYGNLSGGEVCEMIRDAHR